jgi:hypothetical protein
VNRSELGEQLQGNPRAQQVFMRVLLPYLKQHGARSASAMAEAELELCGVALEPEEVCDLLEIARTRKLVERMTDTHDAHGDPCPEQEWAPTESGLELRRPHSLGLKSLLAATVLPSVGGILKLALSKSGGPSSVQVDLATLEVLACVLLVVCVLVFSPWWLTENAALRQAARSWRRMAGVRPRFYAWLVNPLRPWLALLAPVLITLPVVMVILGSGDDPVPFGLYASGWVVAAAMYVWRERAGRKEDTAPELPSLVRTH